MAARETSAGFLLSGGPVHANCSAVHRAETILPQERLPPETLAPLGGGAAACDRFRVFLCSTAARWILDPDG